MLGKLITSLIGLGMIAFAGVLAWYIFWAQLVSVLAIAGALACAALFAFLGAVLVVGPWRKQTQADTGEFSSMDGQ